MKRLVVNAAKELAGSYLYVGRPMRPRGIEGSPWGNPFTHRPNARGLISVDSVASAVRSYECWLRGEYHEDGFEGWRSNALREMWQIADALSRGVPLGCWCGEWRNGEPAPECHAVTLVRLARRWFSPRSRVRFRRDVPTFGGVFQEGASAEITAVWRDSVGLVFNVTAQDARTASAVPVDALEPLVSGCGLTAFGAAGYSAA